MFFFYVFFPSTFEPPKYPKYLPHGPKRAPTAPRTTQNPSPRHPKSSFSGIVKTIKNQCFYYGLGTFGRPRVDVLAIKTAIVAPTIHMTPKTGENVGPGSPNVAKVSPNRPPGGGSAKSVFRPFSINFRPRVPWAPRGVAEVRFLIVLAMFRSLWERFSDDSGTIFGDVASCGARWRCCIF